MLVKKYIYFLVGLTLSSSCTYAKVSLIKDMDDGQDSTLRVCVKESQI